jgi:hypothetical protein
MFHLMVVVQGSCDAHVLVSHSSVRTYGLFRSVCSAAVCVPLNPHSEHLLMSTSLHLLWAVLFDFSSRQSTYLTTSALCLTNTRSRTPYSVTRTHLPFFCLLSLSSLPCPPISYISLYPTSFLTPYSTSFSTSEHSSGGGLLASHQRVPATVWYERSGH